MEPNDRLNIKRVPDAVSVAYQSGELIDRFKERHLRRFANLLQEFPRFEQHLCYADIAVLVRPQQTAYLFYSFELDGSSASGVFEGYQKFLQQLVYKERRSLLDHTVFQAGMPDDIQTAAGIDALNEFPNGGKFLDVCLREDPSPASEGARKLQLRYATVSEGSSAARKFPKDLPLENCVRAYAAGVFSKASLIRDRQGRPVHRVLCIPVNTWTLKYDRPSPNFIGGIFIGLSRDAQDNSFHFVNALKRFVYETIGLSYKIDSSIGAGVEKAIMVFGHQMKTLAAGISGHQKKWVFPRERLSSFDDRKIECAVTPVPNLLEALGKTISFWTLEHDAESIGVSAQRPVQNLFDIIQISREFAQSIRLASLYARKDMSNDFNLGELSQEFEVKVAGAEALRLWRIEKLAFEAKQNRQVVEQNDVDEVLPWIQLAGLIRFFAIVIEGSIEYAPDFEQPSVEFELFPLPENRLRITSTNTCKPKKDRRTTDSRYAGMHGGQIRQFIANKFLQTLNPYLPKPKEVMGDGTPKYSIAIELDRPSWAVNGTT
jgi:hypothetical protein